MKNAQKGLTLIELMVALLLGLIFSAAAFQLLLTNQRTFGLQQALSTLQEDGQMALRYMAADIRNAGRGSLLQGTMVPVILDPTHPAGFSQNGNTHDELVVQYLGTSDCQGTSLGTDQHIINRYYVNNGDLLCSGSLSAGAAVVLLRNVESFQVQYGLDSDKDGVLATTQFVNASQDMLDPSAAGADDEPVLGAIRLAVLINNDEYRTTPSSATTHYVLDQKLTSAADTRIRRVFSTTVHIRNYDSERI